MQTADSMRYLVHVHRGKPGSRIPVSRRPRLLGRSPDADVHLNSLTVSRAHAEIWLDESGAVLVRDLGSSNGTYVGEATVGRRAMSLGHGDLLRIGNYTFRIAEGDGADQFTESNVVLGFKDLVEGDHVSSAKVEAGLLMALQRFSARLFAEESPRRRMEALARFLTERPFSAFQASVLRREGDAFQPEVGPVNAPEFADAPAVMAEAVLGGLLKKWGPLSAPGFSEQSLWGRRFPGNPGAGAGLLTVHLCPISETHVLQAVFPQDSDPNERMAVLMLAASDLAHAEAHWKVKESSQRRAAMETEIAQARKVQSMILPKAVKLDSLDYWVNFEPCHEVAGDYVDVIPTDAGKVLFAIGDVCGKGVQAALIASFLHTYLHVEFKGSRKPLGELMDGLNAYLRETIPESQFVTFCAVAWDPVTHDTEWVNAGHPPPLVLAPGRPVRMLKGSRMHCPLGVEESRFASQQGHIRGHETLVLYTDGMTEIRGAKGDGLLGMQRWAGLLTQAHDQDLRRFDAGIKRHIKSFSGQVPREDDQTYLLVRRRTESADPAVMVMPKESALYVHGDLVDIADGDESAGKAQNPMERTQVAR